MPPVLPSAALFDPPTETASPQTKKRSLAARMVLGIAIYGGAAVFTLGAVPVIFTMMDRADVLQWSNALLDMVGS